MKLKKEEEIFEKNHLKSDCTNEISCYSISDSLSVKKGKVLYTGKYLLHRMQNQSFNIHFHLLHKELPVNPNCQEVFHHLKATFNKTKCQDNQKLYILLHVSCIHVNEEFLKYIPIFPFILESIDVSVTSL